MLSTHTKPSVNLNQVEKIKLYAELDAEVKRLSSARDQLKKEIVSMINGDRVYDQFAHVIATYKLQTRTTVDHKKLMELAPEMYEKCVKITSYYEFRLKK